MPGGAQGCKEDADCCSTRCNTSNTCD
jgi:hypothetical protein